MLIDGQVPVDALLLAAKQGKIDTQQLTPYLVNPIFSQALSEDVEIPEAMPVETPVLN